MTSSGSLAAAAEPTRDIRWLLGVDAGGTRCRARLTGLHGEMLGEGASGPANAFSDPVGSWESIWAAASNAFEAAGLGPESAACTFAVIGAAGLDAYTPEAPAAWRISAFAVSMVDTDAYIALRGATGGRDGSVLIVGTGAVGLALHDSVRTSVGGYGAEVSDEGGGAWIGREAIRRMLWAADGRIATTDLINAVRQLRGGAWKALRWVIAASPADLASMAPVVVDYARRQDAEALAILRAGASHLCRITQALAKAGAERCYVAGGLGEILSPHMSEPGLPLEASAGSPLDGAIQVARAHVNTCGDRDFSTAQLSARTFRKP